MGRAVWYAGVLAGVVLGSSEKIKPVREAVGVLAFGDLDAPETHPAGRDLLDDAIGVQ